MQKRERKSGKKNPNYEKKKKKGGWSKEVHRSIERSKDSMLIPGKMTLVYKWTQQY